MATGEATAAKVESGDLPAQRREEQRLERAKREREKAAMGGLWSRRDFMGRLGWVLFGGFSLVTLLSALRSAFPRVLFLPPSTFKAGFPKDFAVGAVSDKFTKDYRVWIVRETDGFYALWAKCTHLGCTPRWLVAESKFKCPCHGSGFYRSGINFEGPAPRPLERLKIALADDGQIVVDKSVKYLFEKGQWGKPGSFLKG
ncbi:MAG: ubiquinol-cytochrome c reductase iron-sulfur subunit [Alphaproteobacteria bacterium]